MVPREALAVNARMASQKIFPLFLMHNFLVIDFVAPYFDQSGISILLRKKKRETNVFKFLSVLKPEVSNNMFKEQ